MLMWLSALEGHSVVRWEGEVDVEVLQGAEVLGIWSPSVTWERSTERNEGLWMHLPSVFMPWTSDSDKEASTGSKPHLVLWVHHLVPML